MKIVIPGGTGQVGRVLAESFRREDHEVVVLSRSEQGASFPVVLWDGATKGAWFSEFNDADVVINLAGRSVNCRYTPVNRRLIMESRMLSTRIVGEAIGRAKNPPQLWIQASTATIYSHRFDGPNDEETGILGGDEPDLPSSWKFSLDVARSWERYLDAAETPKTRKVKLRSAVIMGPGRGGIFDTMLGLVRKGLGGTSGNGRQFVSWVHEQDFIRAINWLIEHDDLDGVVNVASPGPLPNAEFMREFRKAWGTPIGLPAMKWMLSIGAMLLSTETELVLKSRYVISKRLMDAGFTFEFPSWPEAASDLCRRWKSANK